MKKLLKDTLKSILLLWLVLSIIFCFCYTVADVIIEILCDDPVRVVEHISEPRVVVLEIEKPVESTKYVIKADVRETELTQEEIDLMACLVHEEAGTEDMIGKRLVADAVLNRLYSPDFPNTIKEVIYQEKDGYRQFSASVSLDIKKVTEDDYIAVYDELNYRLDRDVLSFRTEKFHNFGTPLYQHGAHYFSGK